jgi:hypothetical protein
MLPTIPGMTGMDYNAQFFSVEMMSHEFIFAWPGTAIFLVSASQVVRIIGLSHHTCLYSKFLILL